jgi:hypothetical protein
MTPDQMDKVVFVVCMIGWAWLVYLIATGTL